MNFLFEKYQTIFKENKNNKKNSYGYIQIEDEQLNFVDINNERILKLIIPAEFTRYDLITDGLAVEVTITDNETAILQYCFPAVDTIQSRKLSTNKKQKHYKNEDDSLLVTNPYALDWAKKQKIVIIGNKNTDRFASVLMKYVDQVAVIDAYEEGPDYVSNEILTSDYAFVLTDSVPHSVMDRIKNENFANLKIQYFYLPSKNDGAVRLNYIFWNQDNKE